MNGVLSFKQESAEKLELFLVCFTSNIETFSEYELGVQTTRDRTFGTKNDDELGRWLFG